MLEEEKNKHDIGMIVVIIIIECICRLEKSIFKQCLNFPASLALAFSWKVGYI